MTKFFPYLILFFATFLISSCNNNSTNKTFKKETNDNFIDSLKLKSNNAEILFYVDFLKSKMEISHQPLINSKVGIDTIFKFMGEIQNDSCFLHSNVIPDGEIKFYKDSNLIADMQFVLTKDCNGLYSNFTKHPKKYNLTIFGDTTLSNIRITLFKGQKTTDEKE